MVVLLLLPAVEPNRSVGLFFLSGSFVVGFYKDGAAVVLVFYLCFWRIWLVVGVLFCSGSGWFWSWWWRIFCHGGGG
jgi:hypothetical protein